MGIFHIFKLYKWCLIAQRITYLIGLHCVEVVVANILSSYNYHTLGFLYRIHLTFSVKLEVF